MYGYRKQETLHRGPWAAKSCHDWDSAACVCNLDASSRFGRAKRQACASEQPEPLVILHRCSFSSGVCTRRGVCGEVGRSECRHGVRRCPAHMADARAHNVMALAKIWKNDKISLVSVAAGRVRVSVGPPEHSGVQSAASEQQKRTGQAGPTRRAIQWISIRALYVRSNPHRAQAFSRLGRRRPHRPRMPGPASAIGTSYDSHGVWRGALAGLGKSMRCQIHAWSLDMLSSAPRTRSAVGRRLDCVRHRSVAAAQRDKILIQPRWLSALRARRFVRNRKHARRMTSCMLALRPLLGKHDA